MKRELFTSSIPTLKPLLHKNCNVFLPPSTVFLAALQMRCKNIDALLLGTPGIVCAWALQGYFSVGPCRDIWWLDTARILCSWALQGYFAVGHCRDTLRLGTARILSGSALQGYFALRQCKDTLRLGTAGIRGGWALQGYLVVGHWSTAGILGSWALQGYLVIGHCRDASSRTRTTSTLKSNNPTARVGKKGTTGVTGVPKKSSRGIRPQKPQLDTTNTGIQSNKKILFERPLLQRKPCLH